MCQFFICLGFKLGLRTMLCLGSGRLVKYRKSEKNHLSNALENFEESWKFPPDLNNETQPQKTSHLIYILKIL